MSQICRAILCATCIFLSARQAGAQCSAQDVLQRRLSHTEAISPTSSPNVIHAAEDVPVWKTIEIGTFAEKSDLVAALMRVGCDVGDSDIFTELELKMKRTLDLVVVSVASLGINADAASLERIYARAQKLGFGLAPAEAGWLLRLHYLDQPVGEFLNIGMEPIKTPSGQSRILVVANGGAGLLLLGQDASGGTLFFPSSRFVFARAVGE